MKYLITILFLAICSFGRAQTTVLTADPSLPIPKLSFDGKGELKITASANGKPIIVMFRWDARNKDRPIWSQAFSRDNGKTWEWNWYNVSERFP
jgi:hypothetical protein